jgi:glycosyltransferase involved in cell wall biosynthesis
MSKIIYHFGSLAGWPFVLARGFRETGYPSLNIVLDVADNEGTTNKSGKSNRQLKYDEYLFKNSSNRFLKLFKRFLLIFRILRNGSVVHYHGSTILPKNIDAFVFRLFKIPTVMSWGGGDARIIEKAASINPYFFRYQENEKDKNIRKLLSRLSNFGVTIATDPEMKIYMEGFFDQVHVFRAPIDLNDLKCVYPQTTQKTPVFLHVPTHPFVKGTIHIKNAFEKLKREGYEFEALMLDSTFTQQELRMKISECDVYVDELRCGSYGYTALEAAGSGKPTLTFILDQVLKEFPEDIAFLNTNPDTIYENLKRLIENPKLRSEIGQKSRAYVEKHHSTPEVIKQMLELYKILGAKI